MSFSTDYSNKILDQVTGITALGTPKAQLFIALFTGDPGDNMGGYGNELSGNAATRVTMASGIACWATAVAESAVNTGTITFPTATGAWGTITHAAVFDSFTATATANLIASNALESNVTIASGDIFTFPAGLLKWTHE